jgi:hypothetical protein
MSNVIQAEMRSREKGGVLAGLNSDVDSFLKGPGH